MGAILNFFQRLFIFTLALGFFFGSGCQAPVLSPDDFREKKFNLPNIVHPWKTLTLGRSAGAIQWATVDLNQDDLLIFSGVTVPGTITVGVYELDKKTEILSLADVANKPQTTIVKSGTFLLKFNFLNSAVLDASIDLFKYEKLQADSSKEFNLSPGGEGHFYLELVANSTPRVAVEESQNAGYFFWSIEDTGFNKVYSQSYGGVFDKVSLSSEKILINIFNDEYSPPLVSKISNITNSIPLLTSDVWLDGTAVDQYAQWMAIPVTAGTYYDFYTNNNGTGSLGDGTKTGTGEYGLFNTSRTMALANFTSITGNYLVPVTYLATVTGNIYLRYYPNKTGETFAVKFRPTPIITLQPDVWQNDNILTGETKRYTFPVVAGTRYDFYLNHKGVVYGDGSKTAEVRVSLTAADGSTVNSSIFSAYSVPYQFVAQKTGNLTVLATVANGTPGSFSLKILPTPVVALSLDQEINGTIFAGQTLYYSLACVSGTLYDFTLNHNGLVGGDGSKTANVQILLYDSTGSSYTSYTTLTGDYPRAQQFYSSTTQTKNIGIYCSATAGTFSLKANPTPLTGISSSAWKDDTNTTGLVKFYSLSTTPGVFYDLNLNYAGAGNGDGTKTGVINCSLLKPDGTNIASSLTGLYANAYTFQATTTTVLVKVRQSGASGTYSLRVMPSPTTALTPGVWQNDAISGSVMLYTFPVSAGIFYELNLNHTGTTYGDGSKTGNIRAEIRNPDGTSEATSIISAYSYPFYFIPKYSGTVTIIVSKVTSGTFALRVQPSATQTITLGVWTNSSVAGNSSQIMNLNAVQGKPYNLYLNCSYSGDGTKTLNPVVKIYSSTGTLLKTVNYYDYTFSTPASFVGPETATLTIKVESGSSTNGTYGLLIQDLTVAPLVLSQMTDLTLVTGQVAYYNLPVQAGNLYQFQAYTLNSGSNTKTGNVSTAIYQPSGIQLPNISANPTSFMATSTGDLLVKLTCTSSGTAGIQISPFTGTITSLTAGVWADGTLTSISTKQYFSFFVQAGTTYKLYLNDSYAGYGKSLDAKFSAFGSITANSYFQNIDSAYSTPQNIVSPIDQTIYVEVMPYSYGTGTFAVKYE